MTFDITNVSSHGEINRKTDKLESLKRESYVTPEGAKKEAATGPAAARREELARCAAWKRWN